MKRKYDILVLGLGAIGSAAADAFAAAGYSVCGIEQNSPVHDKGSSFGQTRAIRKAYFEDPAYVPFVLEAYELWKQLEFDTRRKLLVESGCLIMGPEHSPVITGCIQSAQTMSLDHQVLNSKEVKNKFGFSTPAHQVGFYESDGGYLFVEECLRVFHERAVKNGAHLIFENAVKELRLAENIKVILEEEEVWADRVFIALGAWSAQNSLVRLPKLSIKRAVQYWFTSKGREGYPVFFQDTEKGPWIYGFPQIDGKLKCAFHNIYTETQVDALDREVHAEEINLILPHIESLCGDLGGFLDGKVCMYSMSPDEHFYLGPHEKHSNVFLAGGFSGHGFKFAPAVGQFAVKYFSSQNSEGSSQFMRQNPIAELFSLTRGFDASRK